MNIGRLFVVNRCVDRIFDALLQKYPDLREQRVARFLPMLGFLVELALEIFGIFLVYFVVGGMAPFFVGDGFNGNFLYSMVFIPVVSVLKNLPDVAKSLFVRVAVSDEYVVCRRGCFHRFVDELYIKHIDNIEVRTTLWGEWFNYGNISLYSFGGKINLPFLKNPHAVYLLLKNKMKDRPDF